MHETMVGSLLKASLGRIVDGGFGWWCESDDSNKFVNNIEKILTVDFAKIRDKEYQCLIDYYSADNNYKTIMRHF